MSSAAAALTAHDAAPRPAWVSAPPHWRCVDFISDLHLESGGTATFDVWQRYMQSTQADAVFILGDLFQVWVGDDVVDAANTGTDPACGFETRCAQVLAAASRRLVIYFIHGNRDFLLGPAFAGLCGMTLLDDPCVLEFADQRWLLSHGDALCLQDTDYMAFRSQVRSAQWQQTFLEQPLAQRQALARTMREQSAAHQSSERGKGMTLTDPDSSITCNWLRGAKASTLIHGHTHRPAEHELAPGLRRIVLSDWEAGANPARSEVLRLRVADSSQTSQVTVQRLATALA